MKKFTFWLSSAALLAFHSLGAADQNSLSEQFREAARETGQALRQAGNVVADETRQAWKQTQAYFTEGPATYQKGANAKLAELKAELARLRESSAATAAGRAYFQTRLTALDQQHEFAQQQLQALSEEQLRQGFQGPRQQVDTTLEHLESHLDIAKRELQGMTEAKTSPETR